MKILEVLTKQRIKGNIGERAAVKYLRTQGYKILKTNCVVIDHEMDIVARTKEEVVFVEVKTRTEGRCASESRPAAAVTPEKQRALIKEASAYLAFLDGKPRVRFDVIEVTLGEKGEIKDIQHLIAAFNKNTAYRRNK